MGNNLLSTHVLSTAYTVAHSHVRGGSATQAHRSNLDGSKCLAQGRHGEHLQNELHIHTNIYSHTRVCPGAQPENNSIINKIPELKEMTEYGRVYLTDRGLSQM